MQDSVIVIEPSDVSEDRHESPERNSGLVKVLPMREWTREEIQRIGYAVVDLIADHSAG